MYGNLFIRTQEQVDLRSFATRIFDLLNIGSAEMRESENYASGEYFKAKVLGVIVKVAVADDSEFPDFQFWINFKADKVWTEEPLWFEGLADLIAKHLALDGFDVARAPSFGSIGGGKVLYTRKASSGEVKDQLDIRRVE
ncbi:MAG: hypothetical protein ABI273_14990 [Lacunisphaera sp.]